MMTRALFYPQIHFRSRRWLRASMLYYDEISRIVPEGVEPDRLDFYQTFSSDPQGILEDVCALEASGFIKSESPKHLQEVADEFFGFAVENLLEPKRRAEIVPRLSGRAFYSVHPDKIDPVLLKILEEVALAHEKQGNSYSNWEIESVTAGLYMLFLASRMANDRPLVSDNSIYQSLLYEPVRSVTDPHAPLSDEGFRLAAAVFETVIPASLESASLDVLLKVREDYGPDRQRFQDKIAEFAKALGSAKDHL